MKVAIHQPNFIPWLPYFHKMAKSDVFIILGGVQFEKNGYQNRYFDGKWVTKPVKQGIETISEKQYCDGQRVLTLNTDWIEIIRRTIGIKTGIKIANITKKFKTKTYMLMALIKMVRGDTYITNPSAKDKYLDEDLMKENGINIEYCVTPKDMQIPIFEAFRKWGIEGTKRQLKR